MVSYTWYGRSGLPYCFEVFSPQAAWNDVSGLYVFAARGHPLLPQIRTALYVGQCDSFKDRFKNHEKWPAAYRQGAIEVHALVEDLSGRRDQIESDLIQSLRPLLNVQVPELRMQNFLRPARLR